MKSWFELCLFVVPVVAVGQCCQTRPLPGCPPFIFPSFEGLSQNHTLVLGPEACHLKQLKILFFFLKGLILNFNFKF